MCSLLLPLSTRIDSGGNKDVSGCAVHLNIRSLSLQAIGRDSEGYSMLGMFKKSRLQMLLPILQSPDGGTLSLVQQKLISSNGGCWQVVDGAVNFLEQPVSKRSSHVSHSLPSKAEDLIKSANGLVLNLSAGGTLSKPDNVVEMEYGLFANTDVSADAHQLPFLDRTFAGVVCCNSFEHYRNPLLVVSEIHRVLKPRGFVYVLTAFNQPFHMLPHHYFNATPSGVREWFKHFDIRECGSTEFHNGILSAMWFAACLLSPLEHGGRRDDIRSITLGELADSWVNGWSSKVNDAHAAAAVVPVELRDITGQAVELVAYRH
jgi:hypothetical protein